MLKGLIMKKLLIIVVLLTTITSAFAAKDYTIKTFADGYTIVSGEIDVSKGNAGVEFMLDFPFKNKPVVIAQFNDLIYDVDVNTCKTFDNNKANCYFNTVVLQDTTINFVAQGY